MSEQIANRLCLILALVSMTGKGFAQQQPSGKVEEESKGITFYETFQGSTNSLGQVMKLDTTVGYDFNKHFGIDAGLPVYFVHASSTAMASGATSTNGIGNVYVDLKLTLDNPVVNYATVLTGTAPTGDTMTGLSTGRATVDWSNHFDKGFWGFRPFANVGVANTISDTHFFVRPFSTLGVNTHLEGGATYRVIPFVRVGASVYAVEPFGDQKVFSKLIGFKAAAPGGMSGRHGVFSNAARTKGNADIARDKGFSAWISGSAFHVIDLEVGYDRSVDYDLNTVSFLVGLNLSKFLRKAPGH